MKYLILVLLVSLSGCGQIVTPEDIEVYLNTCKANGGLDHVIDNSDHVGDTVICKNGAVFYL